jgi:hypothetical protein
MSEPVQGDVVSWRNSFGFSISLHTVAVFCEHTEEMLADATGRDELLSRHRDSLERRATGMSAKCQKRPCVIEQRVPPLTQRTN